MEYKKLYNDPNIDKHINSASEKYNDNMEHILGTALNMPFECMNSAARKVMNFSQYQQRVNLRYADYPLISTGYENKFGQESSAYIESDADYRVLFRFDKFKNKPNHCYYLVLINDNTNELRLLKREAYHYNTETYGYPYNNVEIDRNAEVGKVIPEGSILKKPASMDFAGNYCTGKNLNATYLADTKTTEDAVTISRSAAIKLSRVAIKKVTIDLNDNDIPLNLYGSDTVYKIFPDIGEKIKDGIVCGKRVENKNELFFTQSGERLRTPMINDITFKTNGEIIDINVYCNRSIENSANSMYTSQIEYYINEYKAFCKEVVDALRMYIDNTDYSKSFELAKFYDDCEDVVKGKQYIRDDKIFSNIIIELLVVEDEPVHVGDKVTGRYGGKGVVSEIIEDEFMPRLENGQTVDLIWNIATCVNRENPGQLFELSLNYISGKLIERLDNNVFSAEDYVETIFEFFNMVSPEYAKAFIEQLEGTVNDEEVFFMLTDVIHGSSVWPTDDDYGGEDSNISGLYMVIKPISECMTFEKLVKIYQHFDWLAPSYSLVPQRNTYGGYRLIRSKKPGIVAPQYIYRMKQNAEEKHSATAMSAINVRGENAKSKASKQFTRATSSTPTRWGEMEDAILKAMGAEYQAINLMLYSTSPVGRRSASQLLTGDPYVIDVELDPESKSRSVEKLNAILKAMGVKFKLEKIVIEYKDPTKKPNNEELFIRMMNDCDKDIIKFCDPNCDKDVIRSMRDCDKDVIIMKDPYIGEHGLLVFTRRK